MDLFPEVEISPTNIFSDVGHSGQCIFVVYLKGLVKVLDNSLFTFIGRNTIWIYLWHIPFVNLVANEKSFTAVFTDWNPVYKYIFVYGAALAVYGIQYWLVQLAEKRWPNNIVTKYFKG